MAGSVLCQHEKQLAAARSWVPISSKDVDTYSQHKIRTCPSAAIPSAAPGAKSGSVRRGHSAIQLSTHIKTHVGIFLKRICEQHEAGFCDCEVNIYLNCSSTFNSKAI